MHTANQDEDIARILYELIFDEDLGRKAIGDDQDIYGYLKCHVSFSHFQAMFELCTWKLFIGYSSYF